jgi:hypothetical protein
MTGEEYEQGRIDWDGTWKALVERLFFHVLRRAIPDLYRDADLSRAPEFVDKELHKLSKLVGGASRSTDLLVKIHLADGSEGWVLLHVEIQGSGDDRALPFRMHLYSALIFARYGVEPVALAIMTDEPAGKSGGYYRARRYGTERFYRFNRLVVRALPPDELLASDNPFDLALYAAQKAVRGRRSERRRHAYMKELLRLLHERGWGHDEKYLLFQFIDTLLHVESPDLILDIQEYEKNLVKGEETVLTTSFERFGYEKGIKEGKKEGKEEGIKEGIKEGAERARVEIAKNLLSFGVSPEMISRSSGLTLEEVRVLAE